MRRENPKIAIPTDPELRRLFPAVGADFYGHRGAVQAYLLRHRDGWCWVRKHKQPTWEQCSPSLIATMHEGPIRRSDVQGWPKPWRVLIQNIFCAVILCQEHHGTDIEPSRFQIADWMVETYGDSVVKYYATLPFKIHPLRGWLDQHDWLPDWLEGWKEGASR